ncbi:hypothetical protein GCM10017624_16210 [Azotobacter vinelandii]|nr:hypothetical protein GCM10017624_16210 [Azotobacter vinelandii]
MLKIVGFALFSTRRQDEITRIRWADVDEKRRAVLVRDMKNPGQKIGNDVWCHLPDEAWAILQSMPREREEIFPYNGKSIGSARPGRGRATCSGSRTCISTTCATNSPNIASAAQNKTLSTQCISLNAST